MGLGERRDRDGIDGAEGGDSDGGSHEIWTDITDGVIIVREDPTSRLEDVIRKVHEEGDVARAERVIGEERVEVGTRDDLDLAAGAVKVGDHRGSVDNLVVGVVHAWVGQKLLNCFIFKCFTHKTLKKKSISHC